MIWLLSNLLSKHYLCELLDICETIFISWIIGAIQQHCLLGSLSWGASTCLLSPCSFDIYFWKSLPTVITWRKATFSFCGCSYGLGRVWMLGSPSGKGKACCQPLQYQNPSEDCFCPGADSVICRIGGYWEGWSSSSSYCRREWLSRFSSRKEISNPPFPFKRRQVWMKPKCILYCHHA